MRCPRCGLELSEAGMTTIQPVECPACGKTLNPIGSSSQTAADFIRNYFQDLWQILSHPTAFFQQMPTSGGLTRPLSFALITHWIGSAAGFLWHLLLGRMALKFIQNFTQVISDVAEVNNTDIGTQLFRMKNQIAHWLLGAGPVVIDPFFCLFYILFTSFFVFLGARILISTAGSTRSSGRHRPEEITYESIVRVICFGMSPAILTALPLLGGVVSSLCIFIVTVIGIREVFKVGTGRAIIVFLFPKLLFLGIIGLGLLGLVALVTQLLMSAIS